MNSDHQICLIRSEEEAHIIEIALRTAVLSVVEVINDINRSRFQDYQRKVTENDKENAQLKAEVDKAEKELAFLRQLVGFQQQQQSDEGNVRCNSSTDTHVPESRWSVEIENGTVNEALSTPQSCVEQSKNISRKPLSAAEKQRRYRARRDTNPERRAKYLEYERRKWKRDRELGKKKLVHECNVSEQMAIRRRWKLAKAKSRAAKDATAILSPPPVSPEYQQLHQHEADHSIDNQFECLSEETSAVLQDSATGSSGHHGPVFTLSGFSENHTDMMNCPVVKEEPPNTDTVYIKFEVKEENVCTDQEGSSTSCVLEREPQEKSRITHFRDERIDDRERQRRYRERIRSDPEKLQAYLEKDRRRYQKKRKLIRELPEQIQKQKRAMWREAARRCRARKKNTPHVQWTEPL
ncbi:uncharacterized protein LOC121721223 isoform X3 [Alosa sapidissima]|uniref:uncharacterized protein LOC121721223 isoform X3 n=1 Tax=Alosa sapidissima TaxID=34773 RepID=UPI001C09B4E4|nr:uncharacterized protein LOC121721223 isoform X3 [Alosa sapidissima]